MKSTFLSIFYKLCVFMFFPTQSTIHRPAFVLTFHHHTVIDDVHISILSGLVWLNGKKLSSTVIKCFTYSLNVFKLLKGNFGLQFYDFSLFHASGSQNETLSWPPHQTPRWLSHSNSLHLSTFCSTSPVVLFVFASLVFLCPLPLFSLLSSSFQSSQNVPHLHASFH